VAYELHPETPPGGVALAARFPGLDLEAMVGELNRSGSPYGLKFGDLKHLSNSALALEAGEFAREKGMFHQFHDSIFKAYFEDGLDIGHRATLLDLAARIPLSADDLDHALGTGKYRPAIVRNGQEASRMGINAIPAFLFGDGQERIIGARPLEIFRKKMQIFQ
jgi:predicted DsbA family dithiol-disulfide isomerase